ncbi:NYN domain-containing protein [Pseudogemmatithrix spongiicola]|uniref:NYN domain-containing protein n=1 Tax=Pseudogemmatithrix spongiicola TaxID=3062599 RepID=A0AA49JXZ3_9BACT|nr:NYN domain-containing protein [Gemmatimonadaceae bacterium 'strain 138']WKW14124.1 NYN domain-containing protein [Gemmatimonadaceae bacterium 'strain 318']
MHRGPQASALGGTSAHAPNAALLIDFDNVTMGIRSDLQTELRNLLSSSIISGKVAVQRAYADWRRYPQYIVPLSESSIDLIFAPAYGSSKKNATDIRLAVDAIELVFTRPEIGTYILLSGDSDFSSLVLKLKEYGKYVIGVGIRESSSDLLVQNCDEYYSYNALAGLVKTGDENGAAKKWDPWELVTEAIGRMQKNGDVMRADRLKQVMQEIDATFDEKDLGMSKFSRFCMEAAQKGLLHVAKLENGQLEVGPPKGGVAPVAAAAAPAAPRAEGEEREGGRGRRGRRGRGGRGRDRDDRPATPAQGELAVADAPAAAAAPAPREERGGRPDRGPRPAPAPKVDETIGVAGIRLTRDEAFGLVRDAVNAVAAGDNPVPSETVRAKAFALLGRDSESLSAKNFARILKDAHDAGILDLRKRGEAFEVTAVADAPSIADQLSAAEAAHTPAPVATTPVPRGMGARGIPSKGGARGAKPVPPSLLLLGVVEHDEPTPKAEEPKAEATEAKGAKKKAAPAKKKAAKAEGDAPKAKKPAAKKKAKV